jgi:hypothetical protein
LREANAGRSRGSGGLGPRGLTGNGDGDGVPETVPVVGRGVEYAGGGDAGTPKSIRLSLASSFELAGPMVIVVGLELSLQVEIALYGSSGREGLSPASLVEPVERTIDARKRGYCTSVNELGRSTVPGELCNILCVNISRNVVVEHDESKSKG